MPKSGWQLRHAARCGFTFGHCWLVPRPGPVYQLHHQRALFDSVDRRDIGMIQRSQHLGLVLESRHALRVAGEGIRQHLECNVRASAWNRGAVDFAHAAGADGGRDLVWAEPFACAKRHDYSNKFIVASRKMGQVLVYLGITPHGGLPLARAEASKTPDLDFIPGSQSAHHTVENSLDDHLRVFPRYIHIAIDSSIN